MGVYESSDAFKFRIIAQKRKRQYLCTETKKPPNMKHGREMLLIAGYSLALIIHMVLIIQLAVLLNKSLNLI